MTELFSLSQIVNSLGKDEFICQFGEGKLLSVRKWATDLLGNYTVHGYKRVGDSYQKVDVEALADEVTEYLTPKVNVGLLLKDVLHQADFGKLVDLHEAIQKKPMVTRGVQKGSCYYLYVGGKKKGIDLRLSE